VAIAAVAALVFFAAKPALAAIDFEIIQSLSAVKFVEKIDLTEIGAGVHTTVPQFADPDGAGPITGSDITTVYGNILGSWDPGASTFELLSGGLQTLAINNTPGVGGVPGTYNPFDPVVTDPSGFPGGTTPGTNYGVKVDSPVFLREILYDVRGDWVTGAPGPRPWAPVGGAFPYMPGADFMINISGRLAYVSALGNDTTSLAGDPSFVYGSGGATSPTWDPTDPTAGPLGTLTLPVESAFTVTVDLSDVSPGKTGYVTFMSTGVIKATPKIPEPSTFVLLGCGAVGLVACGYRSWKRKV
jgi:hypothetical protein